jgi:hypothetical protein
MTAYATYPTLRDQPLVHRAAVDRRRRLDVRLTHQRAISRA